MSQVKLTAASGGGTVALKGPASTTGNAAIELTVPGTGNATLLTSATSTGKVLQVVQSTKTDAWSQSASTTAGTDIPGTDQSGSGSVFCVKITPSATSSKILFTTSITIGMGSGAAYVQAFMMRDSTVLLPSTVGTGNSVNATFGLSGTGSAYYTENMGFTLLDSPNSTSELIYKVQLGKGDNGYTFTVNRPSTLDNQPYNTCGSSTLTVMEIGA